MYDDALKYFHMALEVNPNDEYTLNKIAHFYYLNLD